MRAGERAGVRAVLARHRAADRFPGAAWWVGGPDGPDDRGAVGHASVEPDEQPATEDTPFDLASLTKPLSTAVLALLLSRTRELDLEAPAGSYLPELAGSPYEGARLLDLATHRAGLPAWRPLYVEARTREEYVRAIARQAPATTPGTTLYSDLGFLLLGVIVERIAGERIDRLFEERIGRPLGLARTRFANPSRPVPGAAATERGNEYEKRLAGRAGEGHRFRSEILRGVVHDANAHGLGGAAGHAGLFGTAGDVAAIACGMLSGKRIGLSAAERDLLLRPVAGSSERTFGFVLASSSEAARGVLPDHAVGHSGFTGTSLWVDPEARRVFVLLTNRVHPAVPEVAFDDVRRDFHRAAAAGCSG